MNNMKEAQRRNQKNYHAIDAETAVEGLNRNWEREERIPSEKTLLARFGENVCSSFPNLHSAIIL
jgi:hypothetical protein